MLATYLSALVLVAPLQDTLTVGTFNCEFLTRPKVHVKFDLSFRMSSKSIE